MLLTLMLSAAQHGTARHSMAGHSTARHSMRDRLPLCTTDSLAAGSQTGKKAGVEHRRGRTCFIKSRIFMERHLGSRPAALVGLPSLKGIMN